MMMLIVEDNTEFRSVIREVLGLANTEVLELDDGNEVLEAYQKFHPDWVLMDVRMKQMNGFKSTRLLTTEFPEARVIIVTQYDEPAFQKQAFDAGACGFVSKEHLDEIIHIIQQR